MSLHEELHRIADRAPTADVPADLFARARRSRRRDRMLGVAAAFTVVALLAGVVTWLPDRLEPPVADSSVLAVPDRLLAVPERMSDRENDGSWMRDEVTDDPTVVGVGAAAWVTDQGLPVVVDAERGGYHLLDLPDFAGNNESFARGLGNPVVALSPDGRELAYGYAVFGPDSDTEPIPSGVRVVDLTTGELREIPVPGHEGTAVDRIAWSPDGSWLAFTGRQQGSWTRFSMGTPSGDPAGPVIGRVRPGAPEADTRAVRAEGDALAVDDRGTVSWFAGGLRQWHRRGHVTRSNEDPVLDHLLGVSADGAEVRLEGGGAFGSPPPEAVVLQAADGTSRPVTTIEPGMVDQSLSLATALMSTDRPSVERPAPDWPWSEERTVVTIGLGVAAVVGLALLFLLLLARRSR